MREKLLAVCDKDERYLQGMQEYFQRKGTADFQIVTLQPWNRSSVIVRINR